MADVLTMRVPASPAQKLKELDDSALVAAFRRHRGRYRERQ